MSPRDSQGNPRSGFGRLAAAEESFKKKKSAGSPGAGLHSPSRAGAKSGGMEHLAERAGAKAKSAAGSPYGSTGAEKKADTEQAVSMAGGGHSSAGEENMHARSHMGGEHDVSDTHIKSVVKEHGPASKIFTEHDHDAGAHHVHSVHGEKHHHTDHDSTEAAMQHLGHAIGHGDTDEEETAGKKAAPFGEEETPDETTEEEGPTGIPGLT